jgi:excisionase family DNA binding protein
MATPTTTDLPVLLDSHEIAAALHQSLDTTQRQLRDGLLPGIKLPGGRWRVKRSDLDALLSGKFS